MCCVRVGRTHNVAVRTRKRTSPDNFFLHRKIFPGREDNAWDRSSPRTQRKLPNCSDVIAAIRPSGELQATSMSKKSHPCQPVGGSLLLYNIASRKSAFQPCTPALHRTCVDDCPAIMSLDPKAAIGRQRWRRPILLIHSLLSIIYRCTWSTSTVSARFL